jgi:hypothetical protein
VIDFLSIDWPDNVTQSEMQIPKGAHTIAATQHYDGFTIASSHRSWVPSW